MKRRASRATTTAFQAAGRAGLSRAGARRGRLAGREEFLDGTAAFDGETAAVYEDDCCHYTDRGYEILAELIASRVRHP